MLLKSAIFSLLLSSKYASAAQNFSNIPSISVSARAGAPQNFVHPGVFLDKGQLDFMKDKVNSGQQPWSDAFDSMMSSDLASLDRQPSPRAVVECGSYSNPDNGCTNERQDALSAYTMSLAYYVTEQSKYADKAISYMTAWANTIKDHTNSNAPLQTGWAAASWARAGEIIAHTYDGWSDNDQSAFEDMLRDVYLPVVAKGSQSNGNWELVMLESAIGISVFLDDRESYNNAMDKFMGRVPAYIYLLKDGDQPKTAPGSGLSGSDQIDSYWNGQRDFRADGIAQETCRDFTHTGYGISSISHVSETSRIQGTDLYQTDVGERLRYALGFHTQYQLGAQKPDWLCPGKDLVLTMEAVTEVGFNALHTRLGIDMPNTEEFTERNRPAGTNLLFVAWETLTHAGNVGEESVNGTAATTSTKRAKKFGRRHWHTGRRSWPSAF